MENVTKNDLTIISKPYAHPHTMKKTYAKFQNDRYKTARGVEGVKRLSSQCGKCDKYCSNNYTQNMIVIHQIVFKM